ncbi:DUF58 domain-containing protein [Microcoleus sp. herbarium19]|uniref:DUF58 domain-containing protein n=1 Tax=unclassified Microcoleus TaxID=2642155 RepID=UPI002FD70A32
MIPAIRLYLLLAIALPIAIVLAMLVNQQASIIGTLLFDCLIIGLAMLDAARVKSHRVEVTRHPLHRLSIGRDNPVLLSVRSSPRAALTANQTAKIQLRDSYPLEFDVSQPLLEAFIDPNSDRELTYTIRPQNRGEYKWGDIQVRQLGNWGLAWHGWKIPASEKVAVYPDLMMLKELSIKLTLENSGTMRRLQKLGIGTEFAELREYNVGDDPRSIDWKATARISRPLVRVLEPEKEQTLIVLLDRGRLMTARVHGLRRFDWGVNAALSLASAGLHRGDRVGVGVFDREIATWIPPERGQHQLSKLIERLAPIQPVLLEPDYVGAVTKLVTQQTRRALVVLITDLVDVTASTEMLSALVRLAPRYLPFCVTLRDPLVDKIAHAPTVEITPAYNRAVSLDLLAQRQVAFAQLKQKGVLVLDAPVDRISQQLVDRYLQLKSRNQL